MDFFVVKRAQFFLGMTTYLYLQHWIQQKLSCCIVWKKQKNKPNLSMKRGSNCAGTPCSLCWPWARICGAMAIWFLIIISCLCLSSAGAQSSTGQQELTWELLHQVPTEAKHISWGHEVQNTMNQNHTGAKNWKFKRYGSYFVKYWESVLPEYS